MPLIWILEFSPSAKRLMDLDVKKTTLDKAGVFFIQKFDVFLISLQKHML